MKKTLQDQYLLIKEGKGHKGVFLTEAKRQFPNIIRNAATFDEAVASLKTKHIISENVMMVMPAIMDRPKKESYETAFEAFLAEAKKKNEDEKVKAEEKKVSKPVEEDASHNFDYSDDKNPDNMIFDGQFGVKGLGYTMDAPGLGEPKEAKGKYKSSGYGDLKEGVEKFVSDVKDAVTKKGDKKFSPEEIKAKLKQKREAELKRRKEAGESLEEITLREVVQNMIFEELNSEEFEDTLFKLEQPHLSDKASLTKIQKIYARHSAGLNSISQNIEESDVEEAYQMPSVNTSGKGGAGGRRFIPSQLPFPQNIRRRFGEHIVYNPGSQTLYISDILYNNLVKGYGDQPAIKKLIMDIPPMVKQILNKPDNYGPTTELPKEFRVYHPLNAEVEKAKADKFNKAGDEVLQAKLDKIDALIDHRRSKLGKLDEDEDMKALTDKKKVKELEKDIKKLEVARKKVEKMMSKFKGKKSESKDVIDEVEGDEELPLETPAQASAEYLRYQANAENRYDQGESLDSIFSTYTNIPPKMKEKLRDDLEGKINGMDF
jgi:hypothetical protein